MRIRQPRPARHRRALLGKTWDKTVENVGKNVIFDDFLWCLMIFFEETWSNKCDFMLIEPTNRGDLSHTRISAKNMRMKVISTANMWEWLRIYATKIRDIQRHWDGSIPLWAWKPFYRRKYYFFWWTEGYRGFEIILGKRILGKRHQRDLIKLIRHLCHRGWRVK